MKKLHFTYRTELKLDAPVEAHHFTLRCLPASDDRQLVSEPEVLIEPSEAVIWHSRDSFGNLLLCGRIPQPHTLFSFTVNGSANVQGYYRLAGNLSPVWIAPSQLTQPGDNLRELYRRWRTGNAPTSGGSDLVDKALSLTELICQRMTYQRGNTGVSTTAEEALTLGTGVCQDYVHIFLALCRLAGIPCRYVSGLAYHTGETHAWAEICDGSAWYGIDPTNNCLLHGACIKLCHGRDYADCPIERGIYLGYANSTQTVTSKIWE